MKVTSMQLVPANGSDPCVLSFRDPRRLNPYNVVNVDGLDADEIVSKNYGLTSMKLNPLFIPGVKPKRYYELSVVKRELIVEIQLNPRPSLGESYSSLRDNLARMIASTRSGDVQILFNNVAITSAAITGRVRKFESELFSKDPTVKITFACPDGMLYEPVRTDISVEDLSTDEAIIVDDESTAPHGFLFSARILTESDTFSIEEPDTFLVGGGVELGEWSFDIAPTGGFEINDIITCCSEMNNKYVVRTRGFSSVHIANAVTPGSIWPLIFPGSNRFGLKPDGDVDWLSISHFKTYWGL